MATFMYMNKECGNILTYNEMIQEGQEMYDLDDPTNCLDYDEYYELVRV